MLDVRDQFPIFQKSIERGKPLIYLDNASTVQKPKRVIDAISNFYSCEYANVGRGMYWPATATTQKYEAVRKQVQAFIGAASSKEIIFTSGATDGINKVVQSWLLPWLEEADEVMVTEMEHHANFVPWQQACDLKGAYFKVIPLLADGSLDFEFFKKEINAKVKILAISGLSNTLGVRNELTEIIKISHSHGVKILVDASQLILHEKLNVVDWDVDFVAFSGHKMFGPTGIGILYGKEELLKEARPFAYGGGMVQDVDLSKTKFADLPNKHEAGTPNIAGVIGLGGAITFIDSIGVNAMSSHCAKLKQYTVAQLTEIEGIELYTPNHDSSILSFNLKNIHAHDVAAFLANSGIAVRAGHHCTHPLVKKMGVAATVRISFSIYNTIEEVDRLKEVLMEVKAFFE